MQIYKYYITLPRSLAVEPKVSLGLHDEITSHILSVRSVQLDNSITPIFGDFIIPLIMGGKQYDNVSMADRDMSSTPPPSVPRVKDSEFKKKKRNSQLHNVRSCKRQDKVIILYCTYNR